MVGYILLGVLAFFFLLLCIPISVRVVYRTDHEPILVARYLFFKFDLLKEEPEEKKPSEKDIAKEEKKKKKKAEKEPAQKTPMEFAQMLQLATDGLKAAKTLFRIILKRLHLYKIHLYMTVASSDAAKTAQDYGRVCAALSFVYAGAQSIFKMKHPKVDIRPDYISGRSLIDFEIRGRMAPIAAVWAVLRAGIPFLIAFLKSKPKKAQETTTVSP